MTVYFVTGPSHSGKTSYIEEHFPDVSIILDILDVQSLFQLRENEEAILTSAILLKQALMFYVANYADKFDIVIEIPGVNKKERDFYLSSIRRDFPDLNVEAIWIEADPEAVIQRVQNEKLKIDASKYVFEQYNKIEVPDVSEGFNKITVHRNNNIVQDSEDQWIDQARKHLGLELPFPKAFDALQKWYKGQSDFYTYEKAGDELIALALDRKDKHIS